MEQQEWGTLVPLGIDQQGKGGRYAYNKATMDQDDFKTLLIRWAAWKEKLDKASYPQLSLKNSGRTPPRSRPLPIVPCSHAIEHLDKAMKRMPNPIKRYLLVKYRANGSTRDITRATNLNWHQQRRAEEDAFWWYKGYCAR